MLEHVRQGGRPYDVRGNHITEVVSEMAVLSRFNRAQHNRVYEGVTQDLVESAKQYYHNLQETMKHLGSPRGYQAYFESWAPDQVGEAEALVENLRDLFVEQTLDARIEAALPTLAKIQQQGNNMKEAQIFENWINNLSEGTWALPETPEQQEKLNQLMSGELIVGPDATNATEQLYNIVGDDELFDILGDLADKSDGRANIWDDSDVQRRLAELGIQTPESTQAEPADVDQDTAPSVNEGDEISMRNPGKLSNDEYKDSLNRRYGQPDLDTSRMNKQHQDYYDRNPSFKQSGKEIVSPGDGRLASKVVPAVTDTKVGRIPMNTPGGSAMRGGGGMGGGTGLGGRKPGDDWRLNMLKLEDVELARMLNHAGVPLQEGVLTDSTGSTLEHIKDTFKRDVKDFSATGEMSKHLYHALHDYYFDDMPYSAKTGDDVDPHEWISNRFAEDLGLNENLISPMIMPVAESSCNMTMEGEYCPEHGLAECGTMPFSLGEGVYDPDYRGNYHNEFDELEDLMSKSAFSHEEALRKRFLSQKYGLNTPADMAKLPALRKDAEAGYKTRKSEIDADLEKRNQQYMQDKLTDLEYQQDPVAFLKRRTQHLVPQAAPVPTAPSAPSAPSAATEPTKPTAPSAATEPSAAAAEPGVDYSLGGKKTKLGATPKASAPADDSKVDYSLGGSGAKLPNFNLSPTAPDANDLLNKAQDTLDSRLGPRNAPKQSMFQQLAQLRNQTRGNMAENSNDDPINSNSAMTGAYYEGKETKSQEGDALLARIKSLALLR